MLTRRRNQSISLGRDIRITVLNVDGDRVSIGVDAPREVRVFRSELLDGTKSVNRESANADITRLSELKDESLLHDSDADAPNGNPLYDKESP